MGKVENSIKVRVDSISGDIVECSQIASNLHVRAKNIGHKFMLDIGQIILLKYVKTPVYTGYVVHDDLSYEVNAEVLEAYHIISNEKMYTSLILYNPETKKRLHSLVDNNNRLFNDDTITIIKGDIVKLKINNGDILRISTIDVGEK